MATIVFDFEQWTVQDYRDFQDSLSKGDMEKQIELMVQAIKRWDYDVEPTYENLLDMPYTIITALSETMASTFQEMMAEPIGGFLIDLTGTKVSDFIKYQRAVRDFDLPVMLATFARVVKSVPANEGYYTPKQLQEMTPDQFKQISLEHYFAYLRAVSEAFNKGDAKK